MIYFLPICLLIVMYYHHYYQQNNNNPCQPTLYPVHEEDIDQQMFNIRDKEVYSKYGYNDIDFSRIESKDGYSLQDTLYELKLRDLITKYTKYQPDYDHFEYYMTPSPTENSLRVINPNVTLIPIKDYYQEMDMSHSSSFDHVLPKEKGMKSWELKPNTWTLNHENQMNGHVFP